MAEDRISSIMQTEFLCLSPETPIREATAHLLAGHGSAAPVVDASRRLIGILTQKDCFRPALNASYYQQWDGTVAQRMIAGVATVEADTDFVTAAEIFLNKPFRSYPVVLKGDLVGMLDRADLLRAFLRFG